MDDKASETIRKRQEKEKQLLLEQLKKTPIIQVACERIKISRATYYRWRNENEEFANQVDEAIVEGNHFINDVAESQLFSAIKDQNLSAITFWLKHHHPTYDTRIKTEQMEHASQLTEEEIEKLTTLLYNPKTFKEGQELLMRYSLKGKISEGHAQLILRLFMSQMKVQDIMTRKTEVEILAEAMFRNNLKKSRRR